MRLVNEVELIGPRIREIRRSLGLSQIGLSRLIGTRNKVGSNVSAWERGEKHPDLSSIYRVANALGVDVRELLGL